MVEQHRGLRGHSPPDAHNDGDGDADTHSNEHEHGDIHRHRHLDTDSAQLLEPRGLCCG